MERRSSRESSRDSRGRDDDDRGGRRGRDRDDDDRSTRRDRDDDDRGSRRSRDEDDDRGGRSRRGGGYQYQERSRESHDKRAAGNKDFDVYVKDHIKLWTPKDGDNCIRILPPTWDNPEHYGVDLHVHYGIGPDRQSYLCLSKHKDEPCCVCDERNEAKRDGDEDYAKELRPVPRVLVYLVDRNNEKEGVQAWAMPSGFDQDVVKVSVDRRTNAVLPIDHPEEGFDVEFEKTGKGINTKYKGIAISRRSSPLGKDAWLDFAVDNPLPDQLVFYPNEHIAKVFGGAGSKPSRRDDDDRGSRRSRDDDDDPRDSRGRGRGDDDDDRGSRRRSDLEDEAEPRRAARDRKPKDPTFEDVMAMDGDELEALVKDKDLYIKVNRAESDEELAEWICEDLGLKPAPKKEREDDGESRLARMRRERGG